MGNSRAATGPPMDKGDRVIVRLAQDLIRIPTHNPPGNEERIAQFAGERLRDAGLDPRLVPLEPGRSSVVARVSGKDPGCLVLCGHLDTMPANPEAWHIPPLEGRIEGGRLWGLGAADMKGAVAVLMGVASQLARSETVPPSDVVLVLTADEEFGYRGAASVAESGLIDDADLVVIAEPTAGHVYTGQKGELWVEVVFSGEEAHGSTPEAGASAILPAARFCTRLQGEVSALPEARDLGRTTLNIGRFLGGRQVNIVPGRAEVQLDVRVVRPEDRDAVLGLIDRIGAEEAAASGTAFKGKVLSYHPPIVTASDTPAALRLRRIVASVTGREPGTGISPFSTDAVSIVPRLGVPVLVYGPGDIAQAHRPDESIALEDLVVAYDVFLRLVEGR